MPNQPIPAPPLVNAAPGTPSLRTLGTGANTAAAGNDVRFGTPSNAVLTATPSSIPLASASALIDPAWLADADATTRGLIGLGMQTFAGNKTFNGYTALEGGLTASGGTLFVSPSNGRVGIGTVVPTSKLTVAGQIEITAGGFKFADGSVQTTAATGSGSGGTFDGGTIHNPFIVSNDTLGAVIIGTPVESAYASPPGTVDPLNGILEAFIKNPINYGAALAARSRVENADNGNISLALYAEGNAVAAVNLDSVGAFEADVFASGTAGTITTAKAIASYAELRGAANVTNLNSIHIYGSWRETSATGIATNVHGLFIEDQTGVTGATNAFAVKYAGASPFVITADTKVGIGTDVPTSPLTVTGIVESTSGGFKFPDGTTQTSAVDGTAFLPLAGGVLTGSVQAPSFAVKAATPAISFLSATSTALGGVSAASGGLTVSAPTTKQVAVSVGSNSLTVTDTHVTLTAGDLIFPDASAQTTAFVPANVLSATGGSLTGNLTVINSAPRYVLDSNASRKTRLGRATDLSFFSANLDNVDATNWNRDDAANAGLAFLIRNSVSNRKFEWVTVSTGSNPVVPVSRMSLDDAGTFLVDANTLYVDAVNHRVGVGTSSPGQKLTVAGTVHITTGGLKFPDGSIQLTSATGGAGGGSGTYVDKTGDTMVGALSIGNTDTLLTLNSTDATGLFPSLVVNASQAGGNPTIALQAQGTTYGDIIATDTTVTGGLLAGLNLRTAAGQSLGFLAGNTRLGQFYSDGRFLVGATDLYVDTVNSRVGIGTITPTARLTVAGVIESTTGGIKFPDSTTQTSATPWVKGTAGKVTYSGGNVGIGTTTPTVPLEVNGNVKITGSLVVVDGATQADFTVNGDVVLPDPASSVLTNTVEATTAATLTLLGKPASGPSAVGIALKTTALTDPAAKMNSFINGTAEQAYMGIVGDLHITGAQLAVQSTGYVSGLELTGAVVKNTASVREFSVQRIKPVINTGTSNTTTTLNLIELDTVATADTGVTTNLLKASYGGTIQALIDSEGTITANEFRVRVGGSGVRFADGTFQTTASPWTSSTAPHINFAGGNVGIGTSVTPDVRLVVAGAARIDTSLNVAIDNTPITGTGKPTLFVDGVNYKVAIGTDVATSMLTVNGLVESKTGGFKFPDGTTQTSAGVFFGSAAPQGVGTASTAGTASVAARLDHVHAHGALAGGTLHALATGSVAGFMSAADKSKLDSLAASNISLGTPTNGLALDTSTGALTLAAATDTTPGALTSGAQVLGGDKTLKGSLIIDGAWSSAGAAAFAITDNAASGGFLAFKDFVSTSTDYTPQIHAKGVGSLNGNRFGLIVLAEPGSDQSSNPAIVLDGRLGSSALATSPILSIRGNGTEYVQVKANGTFAADGTTLNVVPSTHRVGIKNASPTEALDVTGNIKASGTVVAAGAATVGSLTSTGTVTGGNLATGGTLTVTGDITHGTRKITQGSAIPTTGTWALGDMVYNTAPAAGGYVGWICTTAGTPGTWKPFGLISE